MEIAIEDIWTVPTRHKISCQLAKKIISQLAIK